MTLALALTLAATANAATPARTHADAVISNLRAGLVGTPMAGSVVELERAARRYRISPYFIAGAAGTESAFGRLSCRGNPKNLWGLGSCDRYWKVPHFNTWREAYGYYARFITSRWPRARTAYDLHGYCPPCGSRWGDATAYHMRRLFGVGPGLRYGR